MNHRATLFLMVLWLPSSRQAERGLATTQVVQLVASPTSCGDGACLWHENVCTCPEDCVIDSCGDGCLSGTETCAECTLDCPESFQQTLPGMVGPYGCSWGCFWGEDDFDFGQRFLSIREARMHVIGNAPGFGCGPSDVVFSIYLDGKDIIENGAFHLDGPFEVDVFLTPTVSMLDGRGSLTMYIGTLSYACFDVESSVSQATFWLNGVAAPPPADLRYAAHFQNCFGRINVLPEQPCETVDYDQDADVDLTDYSRFRMALVGP